MCYFTRRVRDVAGTMQKKTPVSDIKDSIHIFCSISQVEVGREEGGRGRRERAAVAGAVGRWESREEKNT